MIASAILDLYDRRILSFVIRNRNNNFLVFDIFHQTVVSNPQAHPLFHSDLEFQYTNRSFHAKLKAAGMVQSMSLVEKCINNSPIEGFRGILMQWLNLVEESGVDEFRSVLKIFKDWRQAILNGLTRVYSNGFTEGMNNKIKVLK